MPFDATDFPPEPGPPERPARGGRGGAVIVLVVAALVLATPFSLAACSDVVRYMRSH